MGCRCSRPPERAPHRRVVLATVPRVTFAADGAGRQKWLRSLSSRDSSRGSCSTGEQPHAAHGAGPRRGVVLRGDGERSGRGSGAVVVATGEPCPVALLLFPTAVPHAVNEGADRVTGPGGPAVRGGDRPGLRAAARSIAPFRCGPVRTAPARGASALSCRPGPAASARGHPPTSRVSPRPRVTTSPARAVPDREDSEDERWAEEMSEEEVIVEVRAVDTAGHWAATTAAQAPRAHRTGAKDLRPRRLRSSTSDSLDIVVGYRIARGPFRLCPSTARSSRRAPRASSAPPLHRGSGGCHQGSPHR